MDHALAPLPDGYAELLQLVVDAVDADDRVRALWLAGSVGRGVADRGSDLDLVVSVRDEAVTEFEDPQQWSMLDPLITTPIPGMPGCFAFTTRAGLRVDVLVETVSGLGRSPYRHRIRVLDRDGLVVPAPDDHGRGPDVAAMQRTVTEFLRQSAIFPAAVVGREDWLLGQEAVHNYRLLLYSLFVEANQPLPAMGLKQWSAKLTSHQREILRGLLVPGAERESVIQAMHAVRGALRTHGRAALETAGGRWPQEVDEALDGYWRRAGLLP